MSDTQQSNRPDIELHGGTIAVRGRVLVLGNQIHLIQNISTVSVANLSYEKKIAKEAWYTLAGSIAGIFLLAGVSGTLSFISFLVAAGTGLYIYSEHKSRNVSSFALSILMNAGNRTLLFSSDESFLKQIAIQLCLSISKPTEQNLTFNLDQRQIFDNVRNSTISVGNVSGDIVNNV